jgi:hypothetical protein
MRWLRATPPACTAVLLACIASPASAADAVVDARALNEVKRCARSLDPILDFGLERIAKKCPTMLKSIGAASWSNLLPPNWQDSGDALTRDGLIALTLLIEERATAAPQGRTPDPAIVRQVIAELGGDTDSTVSRWERFKRWLRAVFEPRDKESGEGVLRRIFGDVEVGEAVSRALSYASYLLLIGFAIYVVVNELRVAGVLRRHGAPRRNQASGSPFESGALDLRAISSAPLIARPGLLVKYVAELLSVRPDGAGAPAMTSRELQNRWRAATEQPVTPIAVLTDVADRVRFGREPPAEVELEAAEAAGARVAQILATAADDGAGRLR